MKPIHLGDLFPELLQEAVRLREQLMPVAVFLVIIGVIHAGLKGQQGDIRSLWSGLTIALLIAIAIPLFPSLANSLQLGVHAFVQDIGANPSETSSKLGNLIVGESTAEGNEVGFLDILFDDRGGFGKAMLFALLMAVSFLALVIQYLIVTLQQIIVVYGVALSGVFLAAFSLGPFRTIAFKYFQGIFAVCTWPMGWAIGDLMSSAILRRAADAGFHEEGFEHFITTTTQSGFYAMVLAVWILVSTIGFPFVFTKVITTGANIGAEVLQRFGTSLGLAGSYGAVSKTTAEVSGAGSATQATATAAGSLGGLVSGATGNQGLLLPALIGSYAAKTSLTEDTTKIEQPVDYNEEAARISKKHRS